MSRPYWLPLVAALSGCTVTPSPIDDVTLMGLAQTRVDMVGRATDPIAGAISVYDAIARALKYNLDAQVETYQAALRSDESRFATAQMLPSLAVQAGYTARNNDLETAKLDLPTGIETPASSLSSDRHYNSADATAGWNVLDFALSYARARQATDQHLIAIEARRKAIQRIVEDTRTAYWRAVSCEHLLQRFARMEERAKRAIRNTKQARQ
jgi:outer membrane protein TolC